MESESQHLDFDADDENAVNEFAKEVDHLKSEMDQHQQQPSQAANIPIKPVVQSPYLRMKFSVLCRLFQKVSSVRGKKKTEITQLFFDNYALKEDRSPQYTYTLLRLILPFYDRERGVYKLQEKAIARLFHNALGLPEPEYQRMANYKQASLQPHGAPVGDFPLVVKSVIDGFCPKIASITIGEVDALLDELVQAQDGKMQIPIITKMIQRCTADEITWIIRVILKDLKIGLKQDKVLEFYHPDAVDYYNATSSLREVCKEFEDRNHSLKNVLRLFHPIKPMLAAKRSPDDIQKLLDGKEFLIETKFDGERMQVHFTPDQIRYFSRNANDFTHVYGKMTDIIRQNITAHSAILDGEMIVIDKDTGMQQQFGLNKPVARETNEDGDLRICYKVFDILYVKGFRGEECNMMNHKLADRRKVLKRVIKHQPGQIELVETVTTNNFEDIIAAFDQAVQRSEEGIIIKSMDSEYVPNDRSTKWVKMKGDYLEGLTDTFDLLIIGGFYGDNSVRTELYEQNDRITHFLLGIAAKLDKQNPMNSVIFPFCKVGTGYTVVELQTIRNKLRPYFIVREGRSKPPSYLPSNWNPGVSERPDCYLDSPANSIILELKAAELIRSNTFPTDYTLRFPRLTKIRWDKDWFEVLTMNDLSQMVNQPTKNVNKKPQQQNPESSDDEANNAVGVDKLSRKTKLKGQPGRRAGGGPVTVMREFQGADLSNIQLESQIFEGCVFYIMNTEQKGYKKDYMEQIIAMNGGSCIQNFILNQVNYVIASVLDFRVQTITERFNVIILSPDWVVECIRRKKIVHFAPRYIIWAQDWVIDSNKQYYDKYGDSYYDDVDEQSLREIMQNMVVDEQPPTEQMIKYQKKYFASTASILSGRKFYIWVTHQSEFEIRMLKAKIQTRGGDVAHGIREDFNYIVLMPDLSVMDEKQIDYFLQQYPNTKTTTLENLEKLFDIQS